VMQMTRSLSLLMMAIEYAPLTAAKNRMF
jgi:hypothetical protein